MSAHQNLAMNWREWGQTDAVGLAQLIRNKQITPHEVSQQCRQAATLLDPELNAVLEVFDDVADSPSKDGANPQGTLWGVPLFIKDLGSSIAGRLQERGSALYRDRISKKTDPLLNNLHQAGLVTLGRATSAELGMAYDTTTLYRGLKITRNPWNLDYTPGGSSGGSAALVAAGIAPLAHSTDGAGSTRVPAALTGLVGLKVTRGRLPLPWAFNEYGNATLCEGALTRTVRDSAAFLDAATTAFPLGKRFIAAPPPAPSYANAALQPPGRLRIALSTGRWGHVAACEAQRAERTRQVAKLLESLGHHVEEVNDSDISDWDSFWPSFRTFWQGVRPAMWALEHGDQLPPALLEQLTPIARKFWLASQQYNKFDLLRHQAVNNAHTLALGSLFEKYDLLLTPAFAQTTPKANGVFSLTHDGDFASHLNEKLDAGRYVIPASDAGIPAISLPAGQDTDSLPIGVQFYGRWFEESRLLQLASQLEKSQPDWFGAIPPIHVSRAT